MTSFRKLTRVTLENKKHKKSRVSNSGNDATMRNSGLLVCLVTLVF